MVQIVFIVESEADRIGERMSFIELFSPTDSAAAHETYYNSSQNESQKLKCPAHVWGDIF